jgi:hypothetical protein
MFRARFRWLLLGDHRSPGIQQFFLSLNILLDSDVTVALRVFKTSFRLVEVYKRGLRQSLVQSEMGVWQASTPDIRPTSSTILSVRRTNVHKSALKAVMVVRIVLSIL